MINFGCQLAGFIAPMVMGLLITAFNGSFEVAFWFLLIANAVSIMACSTLGNAAKTLDMKGVNAH
ncbi:hypothetical protein EDM56_26630 [Brevibacillus fluminis]|uniref:MFS transporter n=2 Tax=Brevibacillus fluminis TaxID=511487 RepID=A0A3M8D1F2_9BACL|nr:hypothetical protein EDM56_26630 [Brevibacillus fluminis]